MKSEEIYSTLFNYSIPSYYRKKKEKNPALMLLQKYFSIKELGEFLATGEIAKLEIFNNLDLGKEALWRKLLGDRIYSDRGIQLQKDFKLIFEAASKNFEREKELKLQRLDKRWEQLVIENDRRAEKDEKPLSSDIQALMGATKNSTIKAEKIKNLSIKTIIEDRELIDVLFKSCPYTNKDRNKPANIQAEYIQLLENLSDNELFALYHYMVNENLKSIKGESDDENV